MILTAEELLAEAVVVSRETRMHHEIFQSLYTFSRNQNIDKHRIDTLDKPLLLSVFRDNYRRYLQIYLTPEIQKKLGRGPGTADANWHTTFADCLKTLNDLTTHFAAFWNEVKPDQLTLQQVRSDIRDVIIYDVLPAVGFERHLQSYLALVFSQYISTVKAESELKEMTFRGHDSFSLVSKIVSKFETDTESHRQFNIQSVYKYLLALHENDDAFKKGVYVFLSQRVCAFLDSLDFRRENVFSFHEVLNCFFAVFVQRFLDKLASEIQGETFAARPVTRDSAVMTPGSPGHQRFKQNTFQKQSNRVNLEVIHTGGSEISLQSPGLPLSGGIQGEWGPRHNYRSTEDAGTAQKSSQVFNSALISQPLTLLMHNEFLKHSQQFLFHAIQNQERNAAFIDDLSRSLAVTQGSEQLIADLESQVKHSLIRNSNSTQFLLKFYIDLLSFWDKLGLDYAHLRHLLGPLKAYIVSRSDSLRVIITMLMEEMNRKRAAKSAASARDFGSPADIDDRMDFTDDDHSEDLGAEFRRKTTGLAYLKDKKVDIRVLLADLYGSKERFYAEYESFIAEKILYFEDINIEDEHANVSFLVNHLKIPNDQQRFGIIIGDLINSRRWTTGYRERAKPGETTYDFLVISEAFWPVKKDFESFKLANTDAERVQKDFNSYFKDAKKQSLVKFHNTMGFVELDFEVNGRTLTYRGPPIYGVLLLLFTEPTAFAQGMPASEIEQRLEYDSQLVSQALSYWINNDIILEHKTAAPPADDEYGFEPEPVFLINQAYVGDKRIFEYLEKDNPMVQSESDQGELNSKPLYFQLRLQKLILNIMNSRNGSCQRDHLLDLIKSIFRNDLQTNLIDQHFEVCLQKLVKRRALTKKGDIYYAV